MQRFPNANVAATVPRVLVPPNVVKTLTKSYVWIAADLLRNLLNFFQNMD